MNNLPKGTIIMWNEDELSDKDFWAWCDGEDGRPNLKYRFPLGGKSYGDPNDPDVNNGLIKENNVPKHRHPLNGEGENSTFPKLEHKHTGETNKDGSHTHIYYANNLSTGSAGPVFETDVNRQETLVTVNETPQSNSTHKHRFTTNTNLSNTDNEIKKHIVGKGPMYDEVQKPFYPRYALINFIMKIK